MSVNESEYPVSSKMFEHPEMTRDYFEMLTDHFRSPHLWRKDEKGWELQFPTLFVFTPQMW